MTRSDMTRSNAPKSDVPKSDVAKTDEAASALPHASKAEAPGATAPAQKEPLGGPDRARTPVLAAPIRRRFAAANSLSTAMALSLSAGHLDGFTFIGHGHTFASAMTGNMVLLGVSLASASLNSLGYLYPLVGFVFGVITANLLMREPVRRRLPFAPHFVTLLIEITVLTAVAFLAQGLDDHILVAGVTVATAMQNTSFRNIGTRTYNSIIMTGNLQAFSNALVNGIWPGDRAAREQVRDLGAVLASFVAGAALGALLTPRFGDRATLVPAGLLTLVALYLFYAQGGGSASKAA